MVPTRFAVAAHIMLTVASECPAASTSVRLAGRINTNPVVIRRITGQLARAGLIHVRRGPGGAELTRPAAAITLGDVWRAVHDTEHKLLPMHGNPNPACAVSQRVHAVLGDAFAEAQHALETALGRTTLAELLDGMERKAA